jgi:hypothetical protein
VWRQHADEVLVEAGAGHERLGDHQHGVGVGPVPPLALEVVEQATRRVLVESAPELDLDQERLVRFQRRDQQVWQVAKRRGELQGPVLLDPLGLDFREQLLDAQPDDPVAAPLEQRRDHRLGDLRLHRVAEWDRHGSRALPSPSSTCL